MREDLPEQPFEQAKEILQRAILTDYPNPERRGCPGSGDLKRLASFDLPQTTDPAWDHITHCSPCYGEFLEFRAQVKAAIRRARFRNSIFLATAAALIMICGVWLLWQRISRASGSAQVLIANTSPTEAYVDLESAGILRGDESAKAPQQLLKLKVGYLDLKVRLPLGSEDGQYELQILRQPGQPQVASAHGTSVLEDHSVFLRTPVDLRELSPGRYYIAIRRMNGGWAVYPIELSR